MTKRTAVVATSRKVLQADTSVSRPPCYCEIAVSGEPALPREFSVQCSDLWFGGGFIIRSICTTRSQPRARLA
jgi:hypothetical protein